MILRRDRLYALILSVLIVWPVAQASARNIGDPLALYGPVAKYDILRNGEKVGEHRIDFRRSGDLTIVESKSSITVPFLFFTAYEFDYRARSVWRDGILVELDAATNDDGSLSRMAVRQDDGKLLLKSPEGTIDLGSNTAPTEHWSKAFLRQSMLNTITGRINQVRLTPLGDAYVPASSGVLEAQRFRLDGDLKLETWYDLEGRWLGMHFSAKDGSSIEYRCSSCVAQTATVR